MSLIKALGRKRFFGLAACGLPVLTLVIVPGCESNPLQGLTLYPAKGKVLLPDGKPLTTGQVIFVATKSTITHAATIESDGSFSFKGTGSDGLPEGDYKIRIDAGSSSAVAKGSRGAPQGTLKFDSIFLDEDASGLKATVTSDEAKNNFEFKLVPTPNTAQAKKGAGASRGDR
jgi:hypothetical protein